MIVLKSEVLNFNLKRKCREDIETNEAYCPKEGREECDRPYPGANEILLKI